jgi:hypothetical protein
LLSPGRRLLEMPKAVSPSRSADERRHDRSVIAGARERECLTTNQTLRELRRCEQVVVLESRGRVVLVPERPCVLAITAIAAPPTPRGDLVPACGCPALGGQPGRIPFVMRSRTPWSRASVRLPISALASVPAGGRPLSPRSPGDDPLNQRREAPVLASAGRRAILEHMFDAATSTSMSVPGSCPGTSDPGRLVPHGRPGGGRGI